MTGDTYDPCRVHGQCRGTVLYRLAMVGRRIGTGEDEIRAVLAVGPAGGGFDKLGRPRMLFEPHVFYRELGPG